MRNKLKDGGPAFPSGDGPNSETGQFCGMSLRDWFAGQAMQAIIANLGVLSYTNYSNSDHQRREVAEAGDDDTPDQNHSGTAYVAYEIADAMLAVRNGGAK